MDFTYSPMGQVIQRILDGWNSTEQVGRQLSFDPLHRLTGYANYVLQNPSNNCSPPTLIDPNTGQSCYGGGTRTWGDTVVYAYDKVGNRIDLGGNATTGNRLQAFNGYTFTYDSVGNLRQRLQSGTPVQTLSWNSLGQLLSVTTSSDTVRFGYDGFGRRVRKTTHSGVMNYLHDGDNLLAEVDTSGNRVAEYTSYPGEPDAVHSMRRWSAGNASTYYYALDFPGTVIGLINSAGTLVSH